jgi:hypothetical protein
MATESLPTRHWNHGVEPSLLSGLSYSNAFTPVDLYRSIDEGHRTSVAHVGPEYRKLELVLVEEWMAVPIDQIKIHYCFALPSSCQGVVP